jgi:putative redox protein
MSVEVNVEHLGEHQFEIRARQHKVVCDQPAEAGGFDEGMTPPEFFLASLGSCAAYYAAEYLRQQKLAVEGTRVRVTAEKVINPARLDQFKIQVDVPAELSPRHRAGVERAVGRCVIHNTLTHPPQIELAVEESNALIA